MMKVSLIDERTLLDKKKVLNYDKICLLVHETLSIPPGFIMIAGYVESAW